MSRVASHHTHPFSPPHAFPRLRRAPSSAAPTARRSRLSLRAPIAPLAPRADRASRSARHAMEASRAAGPRQPPPRDCMCSERASGHSGAATWGQQLRRWLADVIVTLAYEPPQRSLAARISRCVSPNSPAHPSTAHTAPSRLPPSASPGAPGGISASDEGRGGTQAANGALPRPRVWLPRPLRAVAVALLAGGAAGYGAVMRARWEMYQRGWWKRSRVGVAVISLFIYHIPHPPLLHSLLFHPLYCLPPHIPRSSSPLLPPHCPSLPPFTHLPPTSLPRGSKGYAGGDEARMLQRQLSGRPIIIAVGRKHADVARRVIGQFGAWRGWGGGALGGGRHEGKKEEGRKEEGRGHGGLDGGGAAVGPVAAVIMDDGMQV
ncbi:unnamed protein product [Closterium sp. Naga37s-1]|nr:unnamed protein product [Closterium sp. Naga37s-1]